MCVFFNDRMEFVNFFVEEFVESLNIKKTFFKNLIIPLWSIFGLLSFISILDMVYINTFTILTPCIVMYTLVCIIFILLSMHCTLLFGPPQTINCAIHLELCIPQQKT